MANQKKQKIPFLYSVFGLILCLSMYALLATGVGYIIGMESMLPANLINKKVYENSCLTIKYKDSDNTDKSAILRIGLFNLTENQIMSLLDDNYVLPAYLLSSVTGKYISNTQIYWVSENPGDMACKPSNEKQNELMKHYQLVKLY